MTAILGIDSAIVDYGGVRAVDQFSFAVAEGSLCGVIGPNGSGKSTLLAAISRLVDLDAGRLTLGGEDYTRAPRHLAAVKGIARTFQSVRVQPTMTVLANVMLGADKPALRRSILSSCVRWKRGWDDERRARAAAEAALERTGMASFARRYPQTLSYGMQRRVEIARALAGDPRVLLLDEPTAGMTQAEKHEVGDLMLELREGGLTQVLVEHDLGMIYRICDTAVAMDFGRLLASGDPRAVANEPAVREAYMGTGASAGGG